MASSLSGASALGIFDNVIDYAGHCQRCVDDGNSFSCAICDQRPAGVIVPTKGCSAGQVQWNENGVDKCGSLDEYNDFVARASGSGTKTPAKTTGGGGFVKPTVPVTPGVAVEDGVDWKPLAAMAVLAAAVVTIIVRKRNRGMTSNSHGYDEDC